MTAAPGWARRHRKALVVLGVAWAVAFALDLISKILVIANLADREPVRLLGGALYLTYTRNAGAAFSIGGNITWVFPIIALVVLSVIFWQARRLASVPWAISFGLILGGATGNLGDRLFRAPGPFRGHVVDFISVFDATGRYFAIFNLADSALTCGVVLAIILELTGRSRDGTRSPARNRQPETVRHSDSDIAGE